MDSIAIVAVALIAHGVMHVAWRSALASPFWLRDRQRRRSSPTAPRGAISNLALVAGVLFVLAGVGALAHSTWWVGAAYLAATASLAGGALQWPRNPTGLIVNLAIATTLTLGVSMGWWV